MKDTIIGKFGEASVIVSMYIPHDTIYCSPKEEEQFIKLFDLLEKLKEYKDMESKLAEPIIAINAAMAKYKGANK